MARVAGILVTVGLTLVLASSCSRTIEEDEPRELAEHRIEPCRQYCSALLSPECGNEPEERAFPTVEACVEDCAGVGPTGWMWAYQEDGTDACAQEWFAVADCIDALTCEEQRGFFQRPPTTTPESDYACKEEFTARQRCWDSTPSLEKIDENDS